MSLNIGTRVRLIEDPITLGIVTLISPAGYVRVHWDDGSIDRFTPTRWIELIEIVTGDDALPRHDWTPFEDESPCRKCGVEQSEETYFGPCRSAMAQKVGA